MNKNNLQNIPIVILAGGFGTRISDVKKRIPKSLVKIGEYPIIYHIIKNFEEHGFKNFIICTGYRHREVNNYFKKKKPFRNLNILIKNTGLHTNTALRVKKIEDYVDNLFILTYCDSLTNLNFKRLLREFKKEDKLGIMTAVNPKSRFGIISIKNKNSIYDFNEKSIIKNFWVNAGYYIFKKKIFSYIPKRNCIFESDILPKLAKKKLLISHKHNGFWKCMDTIKDRNELNKIWYGKKKIPWKIW